MRRVVVHECGGPERLVLDPSADPVRPGVGELLVDVEAAGVNYIDVYHRQGTFKRPVPFSPGMEGVGRVRDVGAAVDRAAYVGRRVAWIDVMGSYGSEIAVPAARAVVLPDAFSSSQGLLFQALTAQYLATEYRAIRAGDRVLVHAAAGGAGQLLVQWLKHLGAWVVGTTSSDEKAKVVRALGADAVIDYGRDYAFLDELMSLTAGRGVDLAFDSVGRATMPATVKGLALGGTAVSCGASSGPAPAIELAQLMQRCNRVAGGSVFSYVAEPAELQRRAGAVIEGIEAGWLRGGAGTAYDLARAADAHRDLEGRGTKGKLYLTP